MATLRPLGRACGIAIQAPGAPARHRADLGRTAPAPWPTPTEASTRDALAFGNARPHLAPRVAMNEDPA